MPPSRLWIGPSTRFPSRSTLLVAKRTSIPVVSINVLSTTLLAAALFR
jgi:hypothetical protein